MSIFSLPFLFRDLDQIVSLVRSKSPVLETINQELNTKNLHVIAWWPRGFRQLTNSKRPVKVLDDIRGLKLRVMNNALYVDNMNEMGQGGPSKNSDGKNVESAGTKARIIKNAIIATM